MIAVDEHGLSWRLYEVSPEELAGIRKRDGDLRGIPVYWCRGKDGSPETWPLMDGDYKLVA